MGCRICGAVITFGLLMLAGCGGGGGASPPVQPPPHATPTPTPQPTLNPSASASYAGTKTVTFTYDYAFAYPSPSPGATQPPSSTTYAVTSTVTVGSSPNPVTNTKAFDLHTSETDAAPLATTVVGTDAWIGNALSGGANTIVLDAETQTEPSSANEPTTTTIYATPQIIDRYPEANGASWSNSPASTTTSTSLDESGTLTVAASGAYTELEQIGNANASGGTFPLSLRENSDGSATMSGDILNGGLDQIAFSAPSAASPSMIAIAFSGQDAIEFGGSATDRTWYATPPAFYSDNETIATGVALPNGCSNSYGTKATDVKRTIKTLDTVVGYEETTTFDSFVINALPVCLATSDLVSYAYVMQGDTPSVMTFGSLGLAAQTTTETLVLQPGAAGPLPADRPMIAAFQAHQLAALARAHAKRLRELMHARIATPIGGGR